MPDHSFTLQWTVDNATAVNTTRYAESEAFDVDEYKWFVALRLNNSRVEFAIICSSDDSGPWKCEAQVNLNAIGVLGRMAMGTTQLSFTDGRWWVLNCCPISWSVLTAPLMCMAPDTVILEYDVTIKHRERSEIPALPDPTKFTVPSELTNVALIVGGKKLHVSKEFLSVHSPVFAAMFLRDFVEKGKEEVEIKEVVYEEFLDLLHVIYPKRVKITDSTVPHVLALGHRFQMDEIIDESEALLIASTKFTTVEKLKLADFYGLAKLRISCLYRFKTAREMKELKDAPEFADFSDNMKAAICVRLMDLVQ